MDEKTKKNYKRCTLLLLILTALCLGVTAVALSLRKPAVPTQGDPQQSGIENSVSYYTPSPAPSQESAFSSPSSLSSQAEEAYQITIYNGKIGVFRQGEFKPFLTADVDVYLLPQEDIDLLRKGIPAESFSQVRSILEDYES